MYIQFYDFYDILSHFVKPDTEKRKHDMFRLLFASIPDSAIPGKTELSRVINNHTPVPQKIRDHYTEKGIGQLAEDIRENAFPKMISAHQFADRIYWETRQDPLLQGRLKHTVAENYPLEEESALALYIATVLYAIICRPHYPSKKNMAPVFPQWMADNMDELLLSRNVPSPSDAFTGRRRDLNRLHALLGKRHTVRVWGIHGIGKSELVYQYCKEHRGDYTKILYVDSISNLQRDLCTLHIVGGAETTGNMFFDVMQCLRRLREDTLLVIDNMNNLEDQKLIWNLIQQCGCKILVTTRCQVPENQRKEHLELKAISSTRSLVNLLKKLSGRENLKTSILEKLIIRLHRHTTAVVLLAALLQTDRYTPEQILEKLGPWKLKDFIKDHLRYQSDSTSFYEHLRNLFRLFCFEGLERYALENMALVPSDGIPLNLFETWTELPDANIMGTLIDAGLIYAQSYNYRYMVVLKPILKELACDEMTPSIRSCAKLIHNTAAAMSILEDDQNAQYLMQLSQEVIRLTEKDDIPAYIDYLHKSFELAARNNQKTDMQTIADELAEVLTETPYGTNLDKALMQDYQAMVQDRVERAVAYRKEAISHLNPEVPEEKKLMAEILDRIAGDYLLRDDWMRAKPYSDASWSLFRELDLLEKLEAFPANCRRGVILCHAGAEAEGLPLLHQAEKFIYRFEPLPTQNRVWVQMALREAYEVLGNSEEAKKYKNLAEQSLCFLKKRMKPDT